MKRRILLFVHAHAFNVICGPMLWVEDHISDFVIGLEEWIERREPEARTHWSHDDGGEN